MTFELFGGPCDGQAVSLDSEPGMIVRTGEFGAAYYLRRASEPGNRFFLFDIGKSDDEIARIHARLVMLGPGGHLPDREGGE